MLKDLERTPVLSQDGVVLSTKAQRDIPRLAAKVKGDATRPTLSQTKSAEEVMYRRLPFYEQAADIIIDIEGKSKKKLVEDVLQAIDKYL